MDVSVRPPGVWTRVSRARARRVARAEAESGKSRRAEGEVRARIVFFIPRALRASTHLLRERRGLGVELAIVVERLEFALEERQALVVHGGGETRFDLPSANHDAPVVVARDDRQSRPTTRTTRRGVLSFRSKVPSGSRSATSWTCGRAMRCATRSRHCRRSVSPPRSLRLVPDQPNKSFSPVQTVPREFEFSRTSGATAQKNWSALFTPIKYFGYVSDRRARRRSVDRALHHSLRARALDFLSIPRGVRMRLEEGDASSTGSASASTSGGGDGDDDLGFWMLLSGREVSRPTHPPGRRARAWCSSTVG